MQDRLFGCVFAFIRVGIYVVCVCLRLCSDLSCVLVHIALITWLIASVVAWYCTRCLSCFLCLLNLDCQCRKLFRDYLSWFGWHTVGRCRTAFVSPNMLNRSMKGFRRQPLGLWLSRSSYVVDTVDGRKGSLLKGSLFLVFSSVFCLWKFEQLLFSVWKSSQGAVKTSAGCC